VCPEADSRVTFSVDGPVSGGTDSRNGVHAPGTTIPPIPSSAQGAAVRAGVRTSANTATKGFIRLYQFYAQIAV
jgi:hypothetical protein